MLETILISLQSGLPILISHFLATLAIWILAVTVYLHITPHREIDLIKKGNNAAAISIGGAYLSMAIPIASCLVKSFNLWDIFIWGFTILTIQIIAFFLIDFKMRDLAKRIEKGEIATATYLVSLKLSVALILAAAIAG